MPAVGKLLIQGAVNPLGIDAIAAFNAVGRIDDYSFTPEQSIAHGITTFVAQNRGAGKQERIARGFRKGLVLEAIYWVIICLTVLLFKEPLIRLFVTRCRSGSAATACQPLFGLYGLVLSAPGFTNGIQGYFRGMGNMRVTLLCAFIQTSLRVVFTYLLTPSMGIAGVAFACAAGWSGHAFV